MLKRVEHSTSVRRIDFASATKNDEQKGGKRSKDGKGKKKNPKRSSGKGTRIDIKA